MVMQSIGQVGREAAERVHEGQREFVSGLLPPDLQQRGARSSAIGDFTTYRQPRSYRYERRITATSMGDGRVECGEVGETACDPNDYSVHTGRGHFRTSSGCASNAIHLTTTQGAQATFFTVFSRVFTTFPRPAISTFYGKNRYPRPASVIR